MNPTGKKIEKKLNEVLVNYNWSPVSDYSGSMFKEMKKLISDLLSSQLKEVRKKLRVEHFECEVKRNRDRWCECGAMQENARIDDLLVEPSKPTAGEELEK